MKIWVGVIFLGKTYSVLQQFSAAFGLNGFLFYEQLQVYFLDLEKWLQQSN